MIQLLKLFTILCIFFWRTTTIANSPLQGCYKPIQIKSFDVITSTTQADLGLTCDITTLIHTTVPFAVQATGTDYQYGVSYQTLEYISSQEQVRNIISFSNILATSITITLDQKTCVITKMRLRLIIKELFFDSVQLVKYEARPIGLTADTYNTYTPGASFNNQDSVTSYLSWPPDNYNIRVFIQDYKIMISAMDSFGNLLPQRGLKVEVSLSMASNIQTIIYNIADVDIGIEYINLLAIIYDKQYNSTYQHFTLISYNFDVNSSPYSEAKLSNKLTFYGLRQFLFYSGSQLKFQIQLIESSLIGNRIQLSPSSSLVSYNVQVMIFEDFIENCTYCTPFYYIIANLCYDICPDGTFGNQAVYQCSYCPDYCLTCNNQQQCLTCNQTSDFRILNNSECACQDGYMQNGTSRCIQNCSAVQFCVGCNISYSGNVTITNCIQCQIGYAVNSNSSCSTLCGDGTKQANQNCDDANLIDGDGCSANCQIQEGFICYDTPFISVCCPQLGSYYNNILYKCLLCPLGCIKCNGTICSQCLIGQISNYGCTKVYGCIQLIQNYINLNQNCVQCNESKGYFLNQYNHTCKCAQGYIQTNGICHNIYGCLGVVEVNNQQQCLICDINLYYIKQLNRCTCLQGYYSDDKTLACKQKCGDGISFLDKCDDGNIENGDGCSSICRVQNFYKCQNGSPFHISECLYYGKISIKLKTIKKIDYQNKGSFTFKLEPQNIFQNNEKINFLTISQIEPISSYNWTLNKGILQIIIDYNKDLQEKQFQLNIEFKGNKIKQKDLSLQIKALSDNNKLIFNANSAYEILLNSFFKFLAIAVLLLFVLLSLNHKMAGVQMLHVYSTIFFVCILQKYQTPFYSLIKQLTLTNLNFQYYQNEENNKNITIAQAIFPYNEQNQIVTQALLFVCLFIGIFIFILLQAIEGSQRSGNKIKRIKEFVYCNGIFPLSQGYIILVIFINNTKNYHNASFFKISTSIFLYTTAAYIFFVQWRHLLIKHKKTGDFSNLGGCNKKYLATYISFYYLTSINILICTFSYFSTLNYIVLLLTSFSLIMFICIRPYKQKINNISQISNLILLFFFLVWTIIRQYNLKMMTNPDNQLLALITFSAFTIVNIIINIIRLICLIKHKFQAKQPQKNHKNHDNQEETMQQTLVKLGDKKIKYVQDISMNMIQNYNEINHNLLRNQNRFLNNQQSADLAAFKKQYKKLLKEQIKPYFDEDI